MTKAAPADIGEEMETITSADGTEIAFERTGDGPPLVLVHGATFDHRIWDLSGGRPTLAEATTVYAIDRRGRGGSGDAEEYELEREAEDVAAVIDSIDEPVTLLGHSAGGFYSLEAALRTDNLRRFILYEPYMPVDEDGPDVDEARAEMMTQLEAGEIERAYVVFLDGIAGFTPEELDVVRSAPTWQEYVEVFPTLLSKYGAIAEYEFNPGRFEELTTPTLLLSGTESAQWSKDSTEALDDALPNSRTVTLNEHGHAAFLTAPDRFTEEVLGFIRQAN